MECVIPAPWCVVGHRNAVGRGAGSSGNRVGRGSDRSGTCNAPWHAHLCRCVKLIVCDHLCTFDECVLISFNMADVRQSTWPMCTQRCPRHPARLEEAACVTACTATAFWRALPHRCFGALRLPRRCCVSMCRWCGLSMVCGACCTPHTQGEAWRLLWLPLCPVSYALLTKHIIRKLESTSAEIVKLRGQMYQHKKA